MAESETGRQTYRASIDGSLLHLGVAVDEIVRLADRLAGNLLGAPEGKVPSDASEVATSWLVRVASDIDRQRAFLREAAETLLQMLEEVETVDAPKMEEPARN